MSDDQEIIDEFIAESREHLTGIENQLLAIEAAGEELDVDLVNEVFRAVHSIKGAAGFLGFTVLGKLAHAMENVLNQVRNKKLAPTSAVTDVLLKAADTLRRMIDDVEHSNQVDTTDHLKALADIIAEPSPEKRPNESPASPKPSVPEPAAAPAAASAAPASPANQGAPTGSEPSSANGASPAENVGMTQTPAPVPASPTAAAEPSDEIVKTPSPTTAACTPASPAAAPASASAADSSIRVAVSVLDRLMNLAGELVLARNQLLQTVTSRCQESWDSVAARINHVTTAVQETVTQARMQAIGTVFGKFPRLVRDQSNKLRKQCDLKIGGAEVEVDKSIIEAIGDPLTHLIRNAIDHGIESPQARIEAGKPERGMIVLQAFHQAGKVHILVADDGRGMDAAKLKEKAVSKGILTVDQARAMNDREALQLIFRPGFSTAARVTEVSGRGVGMDVVKTNVERLGGTVTVETELGEGSTIYLKMPLTLAIIPSLVVRGAGRRFAIPQTNIRELVRVRARDVAKRIERVQQAEVFRLRGDLLSLVRVTEALNLTPEPAAPQLERRRFPRPTAGITVAASPSAASASEVPTSTNTPTNRALNIIVVEAGALRYGLVVDELSDSQEIVVKPLGRHIKGRTCLTGATILGDGKVALILDVAALAAHCELSVPEEQAANEERAKSMGQETQDVLLFSNHRDEYFGLPMEQVARLERVRSDQIDSVGGQQVLQYRGGTLPLLTLEHFVVCRSPAETAKVYVAVFVAANREVGLIVPQVLDIRTLPARIDTATFREPGVIGSLVHERLTTRILDLPELARKAHPEWFASLPASCEPEPTAPRILLAEDSEFFRKRVRGFLESEGYEVHECEDGAIAWEALQDPENRFQLVLTDIEMPNMNGLELAQRIRSTPALAHLPVVALTSLASEDDKRRGQQVGFNDYQVKLNREQLTATLVRLLGHHKSRTGFQPVPPPDGNGHHVGRPFEAVRDRTDGLERPSYEGSPSVGAGLATGSIA